MSLIIVMKKYKIKKYIGKIFFIACGLTLIISPPEFCIIFINIFISLSESPNVIKFIIISFSFAISPIFENNFTDSLSCDILPIPRLLIPSVHKNILLPILAFLIMIN